MMSCYLSEMLSSHPILCLDVYLVVIVLGGMTVAFLGGRGNETIMDVDNVWPIGLLLVMWPVTVFLAAVTLAIVGPFCLAYWLGCKTKVK